MPRDVLDNVVTDLEGDVMRQQPGMTLPEAIVEARSLLPAIWLASEACHGGK